MKRLIRISLAMFLMVGMLLSAGIAYADDDEDGGVTVQVTVVGNDADVGVDLHGDDNTANVTFHSENPTVLINGHDISRPTVIYNDGGGVGSTWVKKRIDLAVTPLYSWVEEQSATLDLTMDGLAKAILTIQAQDSQLGETSADIYDIFAGLDGLYNKMADIDVDLSVLDSQHRILVDEVRANHQALLLEMELMESEYSKNLLIMSGAFLLLAMCLSLGFGMSIRRLRKRIG